MRLRTVPAGRQSECLSAVQCGAEDVFGQLAFKPFAVDSDRRYFKQSDIASVRGPEAESKPSSMGSAVQKYLRA